MLTFFHPSTQFPWLRLITWFWNILLLGKGNYSNFTTNMNIRGCFSLFCGALDFLIWKYGFSKVFIWTWNTQHIFNSQPRTLIFWILQGVIYIYNVETSRNQYIEQLNWLNNELLNFWTSYPYWNNSIQFLRAPLLRSGGLLYIAVGYVVGYLSQVNAHF